MSDPLYSDSDFSAGNAQDPIAGIQESPINEFQHPSVIATANKLGHVKGGGNIIIDPDGTIRAPEPVAPTWNNITGKPDTFPPAAHSHGTFYTKTLTVAGWSNKQQSVEVVGVTVDNTVYVSPSNARANYLAYGSAQISVISQSTDSLNFECTTVPTIELTVNIEVV